VTLLDAKRLRVIISTKIDGYSLDDRLAAIAWGLYTNKAALLEAT
jgi:hypothetical protein